jgi:hypothetical protein
MTDTQALRAAITGLLGFTAAEEEMLLGTARADAAGPDSPHCWAAIPLVAHNTEFKRQQVRRLEAIQRGQAPPQFAEIDHRSDEVYRGYRRQRADQVTRASRLVTAALLDLLSATADHDLLDPSRHPWLNGRLLWLQIIVRGFWHPMGHLAEYYSGHGQPGRAVALQSHAAAAATYLQAPDAVLGMAYYNLACSQARASLVDDALRSLQRSIGLNLDLVANARRDADLDPLRDGGRLDTLLAS